MTTCFFCNTEMEQTSKAFMVEINKNIIVIKNVPTNSCERCGMKSYSDEVAKQIEQITNNLRDIMTEVAVVQYSESAA